MKSAKQTIDTDWGSPKVKGKTFAFVGRMRYDQDKKEAIKWVKRLGGNVLPGPSAQLNYLVVGRKLGTLPAAYRQKINKLRKKGVLIELISEEAFFKMLSPTRDEVIAMLQAGEKGRERWQQFTEWCLSQITLPQLDGAGLRGTDLHDLTFWEISLDRADFSNANLSNSKDLDLRANFEHANGAIFRSANLKKAHLPSTELKRCDLRNADLSDANLDYGNLSGSDLRGAILARARLNDANLTNADLRKADLRNAELVSADLSGARIAGADFTGANVTGVKLRGVNASHTRGLQLGPKPTPGQIGPNIRKLEVYGRQFEYLWLWAWVERPGLPSIGMFIDARKVYLGDEKKQPGNCSGYSWEGDQQFNRSFPCHARTLPELFMELAGQWGTGQLLPETVNVKRGTSWEGPSTPRKKLLPIAVAAWCEAFGVTPPSEKELEEGRQRVASAKQAEQEKDESSSPPGVSYPVDFDTFLKRLDPARVSKAVKMLKADRFRLFADVKDDSVMGVVKSQTDQSLVYSCRLAADGAFACCSQNLKPCGGLQGALCKHLLVLLIGLVKAAELDSVVVQRWMEASRKKKPTLDKEVLSGTFLRYKGAEAGEIDWRPTETIPEDYYAL